MNTYALTPHSEPTEFLWLLCATVVFLPAAAMTWEEEPAGSLVVLALLVALLAWRGWARMLRRKNERLSGVIRDSLSAKETGLFAFEAWARVSDMERPEWGWMELHEDRGIFRTTSDREHEFELLLEGLSTKGGAASIELVHYDEETGTYGTPIATLHSPGIRYTGRDRDLQDVYEPALRAVWTTADELAYQRALETEAVEHERLLHLESSRGPKPEPRLVRDAAEAEELAAEWTRWLGWPAAARTVATGDGGIDVYGDSTTKGIVVAQVKFEALPTGRPVLQALFGAGHGVGASAWLFFTSAGYSPQALAWADSVGMVLFRFTLDGRIEAINRAGETLIRG